MKLIVHILYVLVFLKIGCLHAQPTRTIHLSKYTQQNGLSSFNIHKVIQDPFGFTWVATQDGLNRFDGNTFTQYNKNNEHKLIAADCRDLYIDSANELLWVLFNEGGLNAINYKTGRVERTVIRQSDNPDDWAISFEYAANRLWIGTGSGLSIYNLSTNRFEKSPIDSLLFNISSVKRQIRLCKRDRFNNIWVCINGVGIVIINSSTKAIHTIIPASSFDNHSGTGIIQFFSATENQNRLLFGTSQGLRAFGYDQNYQITIRNKPVKTPIFLNAAPINWIDKAPDGSIYVSAAGCYSLDSNLSNSFTITEPTYAAPTWLNNIGTGYFINNDLLFLGCKEGLGIAKLSEAPFQAFSNSNALNQRFDHVYAIWPLSADSIIAATNSGLHIITNKKNVQILSRDGMYQNISPVTGNNIIISSPRGLQTLYNGRPIPLSNLYTELKEYEHWEVNSCIAMNDTMYALGTENFSGIILWDRKNRKTTRINQQSNPLKLAADVVNTIYKDSKNNTWVLSDKAITIIHPSLKARTVLQFKDSTYGLPIGLYFDMCEVNNTYWLATYSVGLIQLDSFYHIKKIFSTRDGLCNNGLYRIFNFGNRQLLITTNNGLAVFDLASQTFNNYYQTDGLHSNSFEEACGVYRNNRIYAGGVDGFTVIDPAGINKNNSRPRIYVNNIQIETDTGRIDSMNLALKRISIPSNFTQTRIYFTALNYMNPTRVTYRYKIVELHAGWLRLNHQNFLTLVGFSPGTYHLQVIAYNEDGIPSEIKQLTLIFLPKWYQTWWFKVIIFVLAAGGIYGFYRFRIHQLKQLQEVRNKLAGDLHDDLGSTLNSVKIYANLAIMEKNSDKYLLKIKESVQEAIIGIRDMIWVLDDKKDTFEHLLTRISAFATPVCEANQVTFNQQITDDARSYKLGQEERRNLYMIMKESINNSLKYAQASQVQIEVTLKKGKPLIKISDNGQGFETMKTTEGNGLKNMSRRAIEIKYQLHIHAAPGNGTLIQLQKSNL